MNQLTRATVVLICAATCGTGAVCISHRPAAGTPSLLDNFADFDLQSGYAFASSDAHTSRFAELEAIVRADAAQRFPSARIELGSVKAKQRLVTMTVVLFGPGKETR